METCSHNQTEKIDYILWGSITFVILFYLLYWKFNYLIDSFSFLATLCHSTFELMNTIWWGILVGMMMVSILTKIPREFIISLLGTGQGLRGIIRATLGGILLDLCSHGILMVGAKLYERGVSAGQVIAFLVASPWNSFSLTLILIALIGVSWTLAFILLSIVIAIISGLLFDKLVASNMLSENPHQFNLPEDFEFWKEAKYKIKKTKFSRSFFITMFTNGITESRMVVRWILFGVLLASVVRGLIDAEKFQAYFGPTLVGLGLTLAMATILEVCSEGSSPIAADILTRGNAPGNSFAFLMSGVSTDYTEIMVLKDTTRSLKFALFLPLVTVPQVVFIAYLINVIHIGS